jgi:hypothetical protein
MSKQDEIKDVLVSEFDTKTNAELSAASAALDAELKMLDLELKRDQVAKIKAALDTKRERARSAQTAIKQYLAQREAQQRACNHLKGGTGAEAFLRGQGDSPYYAVIKHKLPCNKYMVLCQRCGKEWHPAQPVFGIEATPGYEQAISFNTNNTASGSTAFFFEKEAVS